MSSNDKETDVVRQTRHKPAELDRIDRKILSALTEDSSRSYTELSSIVNLSAPAVHDRVKRWPSTSPADRSRRNVITTRFASLLRHCR
jgi:hypothetical protein